MRMMRIGRQCYVDVIYWSIMRTNFVWLRLGTPMYCPALLHPVFCRHGIVIVVALALRWDNLDISWDDLLLCFILGGLLSATVNTLFIIASKHLFAAELTLFMLLEFTLGPIWVWIFINEVPSQWTLIGGSVVIIAVLIKTVSEIKKVK